MKNRFDLEEEIMRVQVYAELIHQVSEYAELNEDTYPIVVMLDGISKLLDAHVHMMHDTMSQVLRIDEYSK